MEKYWKIKKIMLNILVSEEKEYFHIFAEK